MSDLPRIPFIQRVEAVAQEDRRRVLVEVALSHVSIRPDVELMLTDADNQEIAHSFLIEVMELTTKFTLHIRNKLVQYPLRLIVQLKLKDGELIEENNVAVT